MDITKALKTVNNLSLCCLSYPFHLYTSSLKSHSNKRRGKKSSRNVNTTNQTFCYITLWSQSTSDFQSQSPLALENAVPYGHWILCVRLPFWQIIKWIQLSGSAVWPSWRQSGSSSPEKNQINKRLVTTIHTQIQRHTTPKQQQSKNNPIQRFVTIIWYWKPYLD